MKKIINRALSVILSGVMVLSVAPINVGAAENATTLSPVEEIVQPAEEKTEEVEPMSVPENFEDIEDVEIIESEESDEGVKNDSTPVPADDESDEDEDNDEEEDVIEELPASGEDEDVEIEVAYDVMPEDKQTEIDNIYGDSVLNTYDLSVPDGTEFPVTITFDAEVSDSQEVKLLHFTGSEWEEIAPDEVNDGEITATFNSLSPVAVVDMSEDKIEACYLVNDDAMGYIEDYTATANEHYEFVNWTNEDGDVVSEETEFTAEESGTYTANFKEAEYFVTYETSEGGSVSAEEEVLTISTEIKGVEATADADYIFVNWTDKDGNIVSEDAVFIPDYVDGTYKANFKEDAYDVTYEVLLTDDSAEPKDGVFGKVKLNSSDNEGAGEDTSATERGKDNLSGATAFAEDGYTFLYWTNEDKDVVSDKFTFVPDCVSEDTVYTAVFESNLVETELSVTAGEQTITATGNMPRGAELVADPVTHVQKAEDTVNENISDNIKFTVFNAFDIRILTDGIEWQPVDDGEKVSITISGVNVTKSDTEEEKTAVTVYRIEDDDKSTTNMNAELLSENTVLFETEHFTVYAVGENSYNSDDADEIYSLGDNVTGYWYASEGLLIITGSGKMYDFKSNTAPFSSIEDSLTMVEWVDADGITSIGAYLFYKCTNLTLTSLPDGITSIGDYAFQGCTNLALTSLPDGITSIGNLAFYDCTNLALTSLPDGITSIGGSAFRGCTNLALTSLPDGITSIGDSVFYDCTNLALTSLPDGMTSIRGSAFRGCINLALTSLPDGITSVGDYVFYDCTNLTLTSLPDGITSIGRSAFFGCTNLALTSLPDGITSIGNNTFQNCTNLALMSLPDGITSIGSFAFQGCTNLTTIIYNGTSLTSIKSRAFYVNSPYSSTNKLVTTLETENAILLNYDWEGSNRTIDTTKKVVIDGVKYAYDESWDISEYNDGSVMAYYSEEAGKLYITGSGATKDYSGCSDDEVLWSPIVKNLRDKTFTIEWIDADGITNIGAHLFESCKHLTDIDLPAGIISIGDSAFAGNYYLAKISLPNGIQIGSKAFADCYRLEDIEASGSATVANDAFEISGSYDAGLDPVLNGDFGSVTLPVKTHLSGDATWFRTHDFKSEKRLVGDYQITLPMSIELDSNPDEDGWYFELEASNNTNWPVAVKVRDTNTASVTDLTLTGVDGSELVLTLPEELSRGMSIEEDDLFSDRVFLELDKPLTTENTYSGSITFQTGIYVE